MTTAARAPSTSGHLRLASSWRRPTPTAAEIVLIPWVQAVEVGQLILFLARERGEKT
jgi:hypothetical protein